MLRSVAKRLLPSPVVQRIRDFRDSGPTISPLVKRYCTGRGVEIGAGKIPYCSPSNTEFLDRHAANADGTRSPDMVSEADSIPRPDNHYDFLLSSHCLEHVPNTIRTLKEWLRVLKQNGIVFLILPHGDRTFDRLRQKTPLQHHIDDFDAGVQWPDRSHIEEIEAGWKPVLVGEIAEEYQRKWGADLWDWNFRFANDNVHYHVWTQDEIVRLLQYVGFRIAYVNEVAAERPDSFVVIARKP